MKKPIIIDVSNVAFWDNGRARMRYLKIMFRTLRADYNVYAIADWSLYGHQ